MAKSIKGFTLIEVALFVALTGLLFMGIIIGTGNSIASQRFFDSTQNFAEFLRSIYSQVSNPESAGNGRSDYVIYGKMISFGQNIDLDYETIPDDEQKIFVYDVIGKADVEGSGSAVEMMSKVGASVVVSGSADPDDRCITPVCPAGIAESYEPRWSASIEATTKNTVNNRKNLFTGTILVVRHPRSGVINTVFSPVVINVNELISTANLTNAAANINRATNSLMTVLNYSTSSDASLRAKAFVSKEVNFCVNPEGVNNFGKIRREVRLVANARNASGVEIIDLDDNNLRDDGVINKCS